MPNTDRPAVTLSAIDVHRGDQVFDWDADRWVRVDSRTNLGGGRWKFTLRNKTSFTVAATDELTVR